MSGEQTVQTGVTLVQWWYCAVEEQAYSQELGYYRTYGLQIIGKAEGGWSVLDTLHDVSVNRDTAEQVAARFTKHQLSPIQFREAVEDML